MPGFEMIGPEERNAVNEVFDNGGVFFRHGFDALRNGSYKVRDFEKAFSQRLRVPYAQAVTSGTAALKVALRSLGVQPGDEVITQCHTFVATVEAIVECGAVPIITEIDTTLNMDPADLEAKITGKTKAIIPVHMLGVPCEMEPIGRIASKFGIPIVEDVAQALGGEYHGKILGSMGHLATFSFDHGKIITTGEGGMLISRNEDLYLRARSYHDHGHDFDSSLPRGQDTHSMSGFNYRMNELQGALGLVQLQKLDFFLKKQRENKARLKNMLRDIRSITFRTIPDDLGDTGDCLVFFLKSPADAEKAAIQLSTKKVGFKNLPDALNWHFAGRWGHIFSKTHPYSRWPIQDLWRKSEIILKRAIAIPIMLKMDDESIQQLSDCIHSTLADS